MLMLIRMITMLMMQELFKSKSESTGALEHASTVLCCKLVKIALDCRRTVVFVTNLKVRVMNQKWHKVTPHFILLLLLMIMVLITLMVMMITMIMMPDSDGSTS